MFALEPRLTIRRLGFLEGLMTKGNALVCEGLARRRRTGSRHVARTVHSGNDDALVRCGQGGGGIVPCPDDVARTKGARINGGR